MGVLPACGHVHHTYAHRRHKRASDPLGWLWWVLGVEPESPGRASWTLLLSHLSSPSLSISSKHYGDSAPSSATSAFGKVSLNSSKSAAAL